MKPWRTIAAAILAVMFGFASGHVVSNGGFGALPIWYFFVVVGPLVVSLVANRCRVALAMLDAFVLWATVAITAYMRLRETNPINHEFLQIEIMMLVASLGIAAAVAWAVDNWARWLRRKC